MSDTSITVIYHGTSLTILYIRFPQLIKLTHNIAEILLKVVLKTITLPYPGAPGFTPSFFFGGSVLLIFLFSVLCFLFIFIKCHVRDMLLVSLNCTLLFVI